MKRALCVALAAAASWTGPLGFVEAAGEFYCEVLAVEGSVVVREASGVERAVLEGDLLAENQTVLVGDAASLDLAYDRDWNNVVRLEGGTVARVASVAPARIDLQRGAVFAKLKKLPTASSFEVRTPTAVAAVRGTEYRTVVTDSRTDIYNFSPSLVFVYGVDEEGAVLSNPVVLDQGLKAAVAAPGQAPESASPMSDTEKATGEIVQGAIERERERVTAEGRTGKIQSVQEIEKHLTAQRSQARHDDESRVTDSRRRAF